MQFSSDLFINVYTYLSIHLSMDLGIYPSIYLLHQADKPPCKKGIRHAIPVQGLLSDPISEGRGPYGDFSAPRAVVENVTESSRNLMSGALRLGACCFEVHSRSPRVFLPEKAKRRQKHRDPTWRFPG